MENKQLLCIQRFYRVGLTCHITELNFKHTRFIFFDNSADLTTVEIEFG